VDAISQATDLELGNFSNPLLASIIGKIGDISCKKIAPQASIFLDLVRRNKDDNAAIHLRKVAKN
jgi:hypothetical protein